MLFDTDVLIWVLRDNENAVRLVEAAEERRLSVITYMELLQGARDKRELKTIKDFLARSAFQMVSLTENTGHRASIYMEEYGLNAGLRIADALIAAAAVEGGIALCTGNVKHYRHIKDLDIKQFRP